MAMGADYSFELIFNETCAPQFNGHNNSFLASVISMNLQRGNALSVMGTLAHHRKLEEIYNLGTILTQEE
jgi:hypothetical protein